MSLRLGNEAAPDVEILHRPLVRPGEKDIVRHDVVVAKRGYDRDHIVVGTSAVLVRHAKYLCKLSDQELVLAYDLLLRACMLLVVIVSRRVARPNHKIDVVLDIVVDPSKGRVDQGKRRIAAGRLCTVDACRSSLAVTCCLSRGTRVRLVERVGVEVYTMSSALVARRALQ